MDEKQAALFDRFAKAVSKSSLHLKRKRAIVHRTEVLWRDLKDDKKKIRESERFLLRMIAEGPDEKAFALFALDKAPWRRLSMVRKIGEFQSDPANEAIVDRVASMASQSHN